MWKRNLFAVNAGAGRLYEKQSGVYRFPAESRRCGQRVERSREELIEYLTRLTGEYPISLLEDPLYRRSGRNTGAGKETGRSGGL